MLSSPTQSQSRPFLEKGFNGTAAVIVSFLFGSEKNNVSLLKVKRKTPYLWTKIDFVICHALNGVKFSFIFKAKILTAMKQLKQMINQEISRWIWRYVTTTIVIISKIKKDPSTIRWSTRRTAWESWDICARWLKLLF